MPRHMPVSTAGLPHACLPCLLCQHVVQTHALKQERQSSWKAHLVHNTAVEEIHSSLDDDRHRRSLGLFRKERRSHSVPGLSRLLWLIGTAIKPHGLLAFGRSLSLSLSSQLQARFTTSFWVESSLFLIYLVIIAVLVQ